MKRIMLLTLAALLLLGALSACSATGTATADPWGYGNVSTTRDGYVNGTNRNLPGYDAAGRPLPEYGATRGVPSYDATLLPDESDTGASSDLTTSQSGHTIH